MRTLWGITLGLFLVWLLGVTGAFPVGPWIHLLLVISIAFAVTGLLWRPTGRTTRG